jgi:hypothetical protein
MKKKKKRERRKGPPWEWSATPILAKAAPPWPVWGGRTPFKKKKKLATLKGQNPFFFFGHGVVEPLPIGRLGHPKLAKGVVQPPLFFLSLFFLIFFLIIFYIVPHVRLTRGEPLKFRRKI